MMRLGPALLLAISASTGPLAAQVTVGTANVETCVPFGCGRRFQQVYGAGNFSGPIDITGLTFFTTFLVSGNPRVYDPADYVIRLSTTPRPVGGLSATFAENVGVDVQTFFVGALAGPTGSQFTITGMTPFTYDPSSGNLLLEVIKSAGATTAGGAGVWLDTQADVPDTFSWVSSLVGGATGNVGQPTRGVVTRFEVSDLTTVPEPGTVALVASGLLALAGLSSRRSRRSR